MKKSDNLIKHVLGTRHPNISARITCSSDGSVEVRTCYDFKEADSLKQVLEHLLSPSNCRERGLTDEERNKLLGPPTPGSDDRWLILLRLGRPTRGGDETRLRNHLVSLPDGTAFSTNLLLWDGRGGNTSKKSNASKKPTRRCVSINRLPIVAKVWLLKEVRNHLRANNAGETQIVTDKLENSGPVTIKQLTQTFQRVVDEKKMPVDAPTERQIREFVEAFQEGDAKDLLPQIESRGGGRKPNSRNTLADGATK